jgi:hypothetical protein
MLSFYVVKSSSYSINLKLLFQGTAVISTPWEWGLGWAWSVTATEPFTTPSTAKTKASPVTIFRPEFLQSLISMVR